MVTWACFSAQHKEEQSIVTRFLVAEEVGVREVHRGIKVE